MSAYQQEKSMSVDELLEAVRRLRDQDVDGFRRLVDEISRDVNLGLSKEVITLARVLGYEDAELLDAVNACGLLRTYGFLRVEAERQRKSKESEANAPRVM